jgi:hypothetical protein
VKHHLHALLGNSKLFFKKSHVYVEEGFLEKIPEACEEEEDMLDMAFALKENSRLGCQIILTEELDGIVCRIPNATRNISNK